MKTLGVVTLCSLVFVGTAYGLPARLSKAQYSSYLKANNAFIAQTPKSVAKFRSCLSSTTGSRDARAMQRCFGKTAEVELVVTKDLFNTLNRFQNKTAGACNSSLVPYNKAVFFWQSAVTGLDRAVKSNVANAATIESSAKQAQLVYPNITKAAVAFRAACKPA